MPLMSISTAIVWTFGDFVWDGVGVGVDSIERFPPGCNWDDELF
jgi:hypothetical protein